MIGIITAEAVITILETLLLANTQEIYVGTPYFRTMRSTCFELQIELFDKVLVHVSRCLIYKVHSGLPVMPPSLTA